MAQVLLTKEELSSDSRYENTKNTLETLLEMGIIPIVNANDTISTYEIEISDNDRLSAMVAEIIHADLLLLLTDIDALYDKDPRNNPDARRVAHVAAVTDEIRAMAGEKKGSEFSVGGMKTKLQAAGICLAANVKMAIANGEDPKVIHRIKMCIRDRAKEVDYILCGDLLNQCTGSTFGVRQFEIPFFGLFGACSTMGEAMSLGAMLIDGGFANHVLAGASSHFCAAEKQFRFPLPLGTQRPPTATWTVTGDGAVVLARKGNGPKIVEITTGKIVDMGVTDANNMGAAMAPAAADLLQTHFADTGRTPQDYDVIATGDLGTVGRELVVELLAKAGYEMDSRYTDCGIEIFDNETQDTHAGGSGCACSAVTFCAYFYPRLLSGEIGRMLFIPTGALMSPTSSQQGQSIPGIAHGLVIEGCKKGAKK